jgi:hypothetical protein
MTGFLAHRAGRGGYTPILSRIGRLSLKLLQLGLGAHELLRGGVQRRARGRSIEVALGLGERLFPELEIHGRNVGADRRQPEVPPPSWSTGSRVLVSSPAVASDPCMNGTQPAG